MKTLIIIGNGLDLNLGLKSRSIVRNISPLMLIMTFITTKIGAI